MAQCAAVVWTVTTALEVTYFELLEGICWMIPSLIFHILKVVGEGVLHKFIPNHPDFFKSSDVPCKIRNIVIIALCT